MEQLLFFDVLNEAKKSFSIEDVKNYVRKREAFKEHLLKGDLEEFVTDECTSWYGGCGGGFSFQFCGKGIMFADHVFNSYEPDDDVIVFKRDEFVSFVEDNVQLTDLEDAKLYETHYLYNLSDGVVLGIFVNDNWEYEYSLFGKDGYAYDGGTWGEVEGSLVSKEDFDTVVKDIAHYHNLEVLEYAV